MGWNFLVLCPQLALHPVQDVSYDGALIRGIFRAGVFLYEIQLGNPPDNCACQVQLRAPSVRKALRVEPWQVARAAKLALVAPIHVDFDDSRVRLRQSIDPRLQVSIREHARQVGLELSADHFFINRRGGVLHFLRQDGALGAPRVLLQSPDSQNWLPSLVMSEKCCLRRHHGCVGLLAVSLCTIHDGDKKIHEGNSTDVTSNKKEQT